jgi:hypothetical protein
MTTAVSLDEMIQRARESIQALQQREQSLRSQYHPELVDDFHDSEDSFYDEDVESDLDEYQWPEDEVGSMLPWRE